MSNFAYAGQGKALKRVTASTGNVLTQPETTTIPNNGFTETISAHDALELLFEFVFGAAATGDILIEKVMDSAASVAGTTYDTYTVTAVRSANWNAGEALNGFFRIKNTSGQDVVVTAQKRI